MMGDLHSEIANGIPQLKRGQVWCRECGHSLSVNSAASLRYGWPKCCGYTMTIDSPEEQARLAARATNGDHDDEG